MSSLPEFKQNHNVRTKTSANDANFKSSKTTVTNPNHIQEEVGCRLKFEGSLLPFKSEYFYLHIFNLHAVPKV
jgi:hypothetical protein